MNVYYTGSSQRFLGVHVSEDSLGPSTLQAVKKAQQRGHLSSPRSLPNLVVFYRCTTENILTTGFTVWYSKCWKVPQRVVTMSNTSLVLLPLPLRLSSTSNVCGRCGASSGTPLAPATDCLSDSQFQAHRAQGQLLPLSCQFAEPCTLVMAPHYY